MFAVYNARSALRFCLFVDQVTEDEEENTVIMSFDGSMETEGKIKITSPADPRVVLFFRQVKYDLQLEP